MNFYELLKHVCILLQRHGRVSYRALKRQFGLDDDFIADLKAERANVQKVPPQLCQPTLTRPWREATPMTLA